MPPFRTHSCLRRAPCTAAHAVHTPLYLQWRKLERAEEASQTPQIAAAYTPPPLPPKIQPASDQGSKGVPPPNIPCGPGKGVPLVKGNVNAKGERIFHSPGEPSHATAPLARAHGLLHVLITSCCALCVLTGGRYYDSVAIEPEKGEAYFCSAEEATKAGFRPASQ
jgi:hypothetical protein